MNAFVQAPEHVDADYLLAVIVASPGITCTQLADKVNRSLARVSALLITLRNRGLVLHGHGCTTPTLEGRRRVKHLDPVAPMESQLSIEPPMQALINALEQQQDPLLRAANRRLQARVLELEEEVERLKHGKFR
jgi:hypothetical protein